MISKFVKIFVGSAFILFVLFIFVSQTYLLAIYAGSFFESTTTTGTVVAVTPHADDTKLFTLNVVNFDPRVTVRFKVDQEKFREVDAYNWRLPYGSEVQVIYNKKYSNLARLPFTYESNSLFTELLQEFASIFILVSASLIMTRLKR